MNLANLGRGALGAVRNLLPGSAPAGAGGASSYNPAQAPQQAPQQPPAAKPLPSYPAGSEGELLDLVSRRYRYARDAKLDMLEDWATCLAFLVGEQWRRWDEKQRRLVKRTRIPSWRVLMVDNQLPGIVDTAAAKLGRSRQFPRAMPNTSEPEDKAAADAGTRLLEHWWRTGQMDLRELEANVHRICFGAAFFHDYWDPRAEARVPVQDPLTGSTQAKRAPVGDMRVEVLSVFDVFPEPVEKWEDVSWVVIAKRKPLAWFAAVFGEKGAAVVTDQGETEDVFSGLVPAAARTEGGAATTPAGEGMATLKVYYELPCPQYPQGRHCMVAGQVVLFAADRLPLPHGRLPVTMLQYRLCPKRLWPMGLLETLLGQQTELNRGQSNLAEIFRLFRSPKRWLPREAHVDRASVTSAPDEVVEFSGSTPHLPFVEPPPALPAWVATYPEQQREAMRQLSGQHEVSSGGVPPGVTAASAIGLLQRADNTRLSAPATLGAAALQELCTKVLTAVVQLYREPRLIMTLGRDRAQEIQAIMGADIGDRDVLVDLTEGLEDTDSVRAQQVADWLGVGLFGGVMPLPVVNAILKDVGQGWLAEAIDSAMQEVQQQQAQAAAAQQQQAAGLQAQQQQALSAQQAHEQQVQALQAQASGTAADAQQGASADAAAREAEANRGQQLQLKAADLVAKSVEAARDRAHREKLAAIAAQGRAR